ncbi:MAG: flavodoxin family protein [Lactobacillales bacterium]|jgi:multimeric flavodoxin WrbA|nr:flavodoxin family protein [Lactobacillales bacterium]
MKKVLVYIATRRQKSNTVLFAEKIIKALSMAEELEVKIFTPTSLKILPCIGCNTCFYKGKCPQKDDLAYLVQEMESSDLLILGSPVYLHDVTGDFTILANRLAYWSHLLKLQGKNVLAISTCSSNGHLSVVKEIYKIFTFFGANVFLVANAAEDYPNQLNNEEWMQKTCRKVVEKTLKVWDHPHSNKRLEQQFKGYKNIMMARVGNGEDSFEGNYWLKEQMLDYETFADYLQNEVINKERVNRV